MLGRAAVAMWWNVAPEMQEEFEDWHTHEHMPERLAIPGFLRGTRWRAAGEAPSYFILYEVARVSVLTGPGYMARLNDPTPWSRKMMPHHRNMVRSLCRVEASSGAAAAQDMLTVRFSTQAGAQERLKTWLLEILPTLPSRKGLVAAHLLVDAARTELTAEQKIRGGDGTADWVVLVNGYDAGAVAGVAANELGQENLAARGAAPGSIARIYRLAYSLLPAAL